MVINKKDTIKKAEILKAIAHPVRLCIVHQLYVKGESNVNSFIDCMDISQSNVSQHLGKLKDLGLVSARRDANKLFYSLNSTFLESVIKTIFQQ